LVCFALGNPGKKYALSRHNIGFMVADTLAHRLGKKFKSDSDYQWFAQELNDKKLVVVKPLLYMNNSGVIVKECLEHFSVPPQAVLVVYDDFALPFGRIRIRERGSDGGHQGLASIIYHLATNDFPRLRIGIGNPLPEISYSEYVLAKFTGQERKLLPEIIERSIEALLCAFESGIRKAMTLYNAKPAN
jgi:peptidyl-tRNA hydrolase, PTH1 family